VWRRVLPDDQSAEGNNSLIEGSVGAIATLDHRPCLGSGVQVGAIEPRSWVGPRRSARSQAGDLGVGVVREDGIAWGQTVSVQERTRGERSSRRFCSGSARSDQIGGAAIGCTWVPSTSDPRKATLGAADRGRCPPFLFLCQLPIGSARSRKLGKTWSNSVAVLISPCCSRSDLSRLVVEQTQIGSEPAT
jgi:hypothetical protein